MKFSLLRISSTSNTCPGLSMKVSGFGAPGEFGAQGFGGEPVAKNKFTTISGLANLKLEYCP